MHTNSLEQFTEKLASSAPAPGGGGAAAAAGALGAALCSMAGNLTRGKKKYADVEPDIIRMIHASNELSARFLALINGDAEAFEPLAKAYSLPKDTPGYDEIMRKTTLEACSAAVEIMQCACRSIELLEEMLQKCSRMMISDVACGAILAKAALESASYNIYVNTKTLRGDAEAAALEADADRMRSVYGARADAIAAEVMSSLRI